MNFVVQGRKPIPLHFPAAVAGDYKNGRIAVKEYLRDAPVLVHRFDLFLSLAGAGHFGPSRSPTPCFNAGTEAEQLLVVDQHLLFFADWVST